MLAESDRLDASGGTELNLGYCWEHLGRFGRAYEAYRASVVHYEAKGKVERRDEASTHAAAIRSKVSVLHFQGDPGATVTIDGERRVVDHGTVVVDRGRHSVALSIDGAAQTVDVVATSDDVTVAVPAAPPPPMGPLAVVIPAAPPPRPEAPAPTSGRRTAAWVTGAVGVGLLSSGVVTGIVALDHERRSDAECPADRCTQLGVDQHALARSFAITADVLVVTSVLALGVATYLFLTSSSAPVRSAWVNGITF